jgi:hypothetical protein
MYKVFHALFEIQYVCIPSSQFEKSSLVLTEIDIRAKQHRPEKFMQKSHHLEVVKQPALSTFKAIQTVLFIRARLLKSFGTHMCCFWFTLILLVKLV